MKDTNNNDLAYINYEKLYGVDGVGLPNVASKTEDVEVRRTRKQLKMMITFNDGTSLYL